MARLKRFSAIEHKELIEVRDCILNPYKERNSFIKRSDFACTKSPTFSSLYVAPLDERKKISDVKLLN